MAQRARKVRGRSDQRRSQREQASADIIPRSKTCLLARAFLRGRQWRSAHVKCAGGAISDAASVSRLLRIL